MIKVIDIKPIMADYVTVLSENDLEKIIELPLVEPCKELYKKNIKTLMSSCNMYNVKGLEQYYKSNIILKTYPYGQYYAWITIDYDSLSEDNKKVLAIKHDLNPELFLYLSERPRDNFNVPIDFKMRKSEYIHTVFYTPRNIIMRYPLTPETTAKEVSEYFLDIVKDLQHQEEYSKEKSTRAKLIKLAKQYEYYLNNMGFKIDDNILYDPCIVDYNIEGLKEYAIDTSGELERTLFILRILDIFNLLKKDSIIKDINFTKEYIYFSLNDVNYIIGYNSSKQTTNFIQLGNIQDSKDILSKQKELLDLYSSFDHYNLLSKARSNTSSSLKRLG